MTPQQLLAVRDLSHHIEWAITTWSGKYNWEDPDIHKVILAAFSWNGITVEQEIEKRLPNLGKLLTREEALKEMDE
jgi:hypothetical protein